MNAFRRTIEHARLDLVEVVQSRWLPFHAAVYAALAAVFLFAGFRESQVLGFTGMGRVMLSLCNALILLLPLAALTGTVHVVNRSREDGTFELLFSQPTTRSDYFLAVTLVRYLTVLAPLAALVGLLALAGWALGAGGGEWGWTFAARSLAICASLVWCFAAIGLAASTWVRSRARSLMYLLGIWLGSVALLDFALMGVMLQWRLQPQAVFLLASLNPVHCARLALLSAAEPTLSVLGPVGFYLANRVGVEWLFTLGVAQPAAVGAAVWLAAWRSFLKSDLV